jgi:hypothetical protein
MYKFPSQYNGYDYKGRKVYNLDSGDSPPPPTDQKVEQTNLPAYARPYFENLLQRGQAESYRQYTPYQGERIAGFTPAQMEVQRQAMGMETPGQFGVGTGMVGAGGFASLGAGQYQPGQFQTTGIETPELTQYQIGAPQTFGQQQAEQYMSPFMQNVVDVQKAAAIRDAQKTQLGANLGAVRQGTYGGARQLLAQTERERALGGQLGDIQARGLQSAFDQAQQQFERDRAAQLGVSGQNLAALLGVQQLGAGQSMEAQRANQQALMDIQRMNEQSRQFGSDVGLRGAGQAIQAGQTLGQLGTAQQEADLRRLTAQEAVGSQQRAMEQQKLDQRYADFLRQRDYPMEQLGYYSALLRGLPMQMGSTTTTYAQPPSMISQLAGLGLTGYGIAQGARTLGAKNGGLINAGLYRMERG